MRRGGRGLLVAAAISMVVLAAGCSSSGTASRATVTSRAATGSTVPAPAATAASTASPGSVATTTTDTASTASGAGAIQVSGALNGYLSCNGVGDVPMSFAGGQAGVQIYGIQSGVWSVGATWLASGAYQHGYWGPPDGTQVSGSITRETDGDAVNFAFHKVVFRAGPTGPGGVSNPVAGTTVTLNGVLRGSAGDIADNAPC